MRVPFSPFSSGRRLSIYRSRNSERGIYIVFFAILGVAVVLLLALSIGLGLVSMASTKIQQVSGLISLAALEEYITRRSAGSSDPKADALESAEDILQRNELPGSGAPLSGLGLDTPGPGGLLQFGTYYAETPSGGGDPCSDPGAIPQGSYPCFAPDSLGGVINAARVNLQTDSAASVLAPFASILGQEQFNVSGATTAALVTTCTAYLFDLSFSSTRDTHRRSDDRVPPGNSCPTHVGGPNGLLDPAPAAKPLQYICSRDENVQIDDANNIMGYFAYRRRMLRRESVATLFNPEDSDYLGNFGQCAYANMYDYGGVSNIEGTSWCNITYYGNSERNRPGASARSHYRQDYVRMKSREEDLFVDGFRNPEPLNSFFLGINAGLAVVEGRSAIGDTGAIIPFSGFLRFPYPQTGMSSDLALLRQISNLDNRSRIVGGAVTDPVHPNPVTMGWVPYETGDLDFQGNTDIILAIREAITRLTTCPESSRRAIVIFSDGLATVAYDATGMRRPDPYRNDYTVFTDYENELLTSTLYSAEPILKDLQDEKITLTAVVAGSDVGPNYRYWINPATGFPGSPREQYQAGEPLATIFDIAPEGVGTDAEAYDQVTQTVGVKFKRPMGKLGELALLSGGLACPVLPVCQPSDCACGGTSCYEAAPPFGLKPCAVAGMGGFLRCAAYETQTTAVQAATCVSKAIGGNPYILVQQ